MNRKRLLRFLWIGVSICAPSVVGSELRAEDVAPDFQREIVPLLTKYCTGCHNADDREGELSLASFADIQTGGEHGPVIVAGQSRSSRLWRVLSGETEPKMPPDGEAEPDEDAIAKLAAWIDAGAQGPDGEEIDPTIINVPKIAAAQDAIAPICDVAWSPDGKLIAIARFKTLQLLDAETRQVQLQLDDHPGKINSVSFSPSGKLLVVATGIAGQYGEATVWNSQDGTLVARFVGHRDTLYAAAIDPDEKLLATAGYDRRIAIWDLKTTKQLRLVTGHNGAIYDLAFSPDGTVIASASADETIKLWLVATGERLDTLSQPLKEQLTVAFSPDGKYVVGGGADNRVRVWRWVSKMKPQINPLVFARFGHEGAIVRLRFSPRGDLLASVADDRTLELWHTERFTQVHTFPQQPDVASGLSFSPSADQLAVGRLDGSFEVYPVPTVARPTPKATTIVQALPLNPETADRPMADAEEVEPNDDVKHATSITLPATISGVINNVADHKADVDLFRFEAHAGQRLMLETEAARSKSPLDSRIAVLDDGGLPVPSLLLQAVRDSYFTFRGKNSSQIDDFRLHNSQEMGLNEYVYARGEVVKLYRFPEGPDSGFWVYPDEGERFTYFDTTAISHALHEPCYGVEPHPPGSKLIPNGLPVFTLYYENDDDALREYGNDSRLSFTAPETGTYFARVSDVRGFGGDEYKYQLTVRPAPPDFEVTLNGANPTVPLGAGQRISLRVRRIDGFDGEVRIDIKDLPQGFHAMTPLVIQHDQIKAYSAIYATQWASAPLEERAKGSRVTATATIDGKEVVKEVNNLGEIKLGDPAKFSAKFAPPGVKPPELGDPAAEFFISPGETITASVQIVRRGYDGGVNFGKSASGWNLPHGVYIDNVGLNGIRISEGQTERTFFITAAKSVAPTTRKFFLESVGPSGSITTWPAILHVREKSTTAGP